MMFGTAKDFAALLNIAHGKRCPPRPASSATVPPSMIDQPHMPPNLRSCFPASPTGQTPDESASKSDQRSVYDLPTKKMELCWCSDGNAPGSVPYPYAIPMVLLSITLENRPLGTRIDTPIPPRTRGILVPEIGNKVLTAATHRSTIRIPSRAWRRRELFLLFLFGSTIQKGGHSGMTAYSADSVIIGVPTRAAIAQKPPSADPTRLRTRSKHGLDPHPL